MKNKNVIIGIVIAVVVVAAIIVGVILLNNNTNKEENISGELESIMEKIYAGANEEFPNLQNIPVTKENSKNFIGIENADFVEALASEPLINAMAHSVVLVRVKPETDIEKFKAEIKEKVDPRKWICVGVEKENIIVESKGDLVLLILDNEVPQKLQESFKALTNK